MRSQQSSVDGKISRRSRVRLHVDTPLVRIQAVRLEGTGLAKNFDLVDVLVAAVVSLARIALGVLVGKGRAEAFHNSLGGEVLTGNQLQTGPLSVLLLLDDVEQLRIVDLQGDLARKRSGNGGHSKRREN